MCVASVLAELNTRRRQAAGWQSGIRGYLSVLLAILISLPLLNEIVRKYVWYSDLVFVVVAVVVSCGVIWTFGKGMTLHRRMATIYLLGILYLAVGGVATLSRPEATIGAYFVGFHALVVPFLYFVASHYLANRTPDPVWLAVKVVTFWSAVILAVALAQLVLGAGHKINRLPGDLGFGVYTYAGGESAPGVFRPASIFLHTGKLGQIALTVVVFKLAVLVQRSKLPRWFLASVLIDIAVLVVSGQRAAWMLFLLVTLVAVSTQPIRKKARIASLAAIVVGSILMVSEAGGARVISAVGGRVAFTLGTAADRLYSTLFIPWEAVMDVAGFLGGGFGMFTVGSGAFGGQPLYLAVTEGQPEGTWHRVLGETGFPGLALFIAIFVGFTVLIYRSYRSTSTQQRPAALCLLWWLGAMAAWGTIHDVLGNSTAVGLAFVLGGLGAWAPSQR